MDADQILITKLMVPITPHRVVVRPRLAPVTGLPRFTLVCAPAGYGKTVLLANWAGSGEVPAAWLSLDAADNDPIRFLLHFIAALQSVHPGCGAAIAESLQSQQPPAPLAAVQVLINQIGAGARSCLMILDDYHVIDQPVVHATVEHLIRHQPPQLRLVVGSRSPPPFSLSRLRAQGHLRDVGVEDLRFTPEEAGRFMREGMDLSLSEDDVAMLEARTEGWVAGLQMAALSMRRHPDAVAFIEKFSGASAHVSDFLIDEVLRSLSPEIESFLLRASILERFCPAVCDAMTGRDDSRAMIESLERQNLFLARFDTQRQWYRFHHLFASLLQSRLEEVMPGETLELHRRAARWFSANQHYQEAIEHAFRARDFALAADLLERHGYVLSSHGRTGAILAWADMLPPASLSARPALCLTCAWSSFFINDLTRLDRYLVMAEDYLLKRRSAPYTGQEQVMLGQDLLLRSCQKRYRGDSEGAMRLAQQALPYFEEGRILHGAALGCVAICQLMRGDLEAAMAAFAKIAEVSPQQRNLLVPLTAVLGLARACYLAGRLQDAELVYRKALRQCAECGWQDLPVCGMLHIGLGELEFARNRLEQAEALLEQGVRMTAQGLQYYCDWGCLLLAQVQLELRHHQTALVPAQELELSRHLDTHIIDVPRPAIELLHLWLRQDRLDRLGAWAAGRDFGATQGIDPEFEPECLVYARWLMHEKRWGEAAALLDRLAAQPGVARRLVVFLQVRILQALTAQIRDDLACALDCLREALALAEREGMARAFLDEGAALGALLQRLVLSGVASTFGRELLSAFRAEAPAALAGLAEPLTAKEEQVIQCLAQGLSNQQIADTLFVSLNTIKTHLKNIYRKLGVSSRQQAAELLRQTALS